MQRNAEKNGGGNVLRNYVYLFELDSVRKTDAEIIAGQKALYNEIVVNGNIVVMTCNQLVDSRGFFSLLNQPEYQTQLISLFENGAIRISQYGDVRTLAQYLINSVESEKEFLYSALPVKYSQKRLLALIRRSLVYSDLSEIYEYYTGVRPNEDLTDLFIETDEQNRTRRSSLIPESTADPAKDEAVIHEMRGILENLYHLLATVLKLSTLHAIYIHPRNPDEYRDCRMHHLLRIVAGFENLPDDNWTKALEIITGLECYRADNDNRSVYLREIKRHFEKTAAAEEQAGSLTAHRYAEVIVNLCYNYACEISICNISKHYNFTELSESGAAQTSFKTDFISRFYQDWNNGENAGEKYLTEEKDHFEEFTRLKQLPDFAEAVRFTEYVSYKNDPSGNPEIYRYEYRLRERILDQKKGVLFSILGKVVVALICFAITCGLEVAFDFLESSVDVYFINYAAVKLLAFLFLSEAVTSGISRIFPGFLSLSDVLSSMWHLLTDSAHTLFRKSAAYRSGYAENAADSAGFCEKASKSAPVDYLLSPEMKKYLRMIARSKENEALFRESDAYPIMKLDTKESLRQLVRCEEICQYRFGVIYRSPYNTLLVDPIAGNDGIFPYERVYPTSKKAGVVTVPVYKDSFILLKQYRHAPRALQYSFPRGFAEPGCTPEEDAGRELKEEIGAVITKTPQLLGRVIADSGLTAARVYVYYVEIDDYARDAFGHEGIKENVRVPCCTMAQWIREGNTDDGFTLSAFALYAARKDEEGIND